MVFILLLHKKTIGTIMKILLHKRIAETLTEILLQKSSNIFVLGFLPLEICLATGILLQIPVTMISAKNIYLTSVFFKFDNVYINDRSGRTKFHGVPLVASKMHLALSINLMSHKNRRVN
ncbi:hypothetical protein ABZP36_025309 [Zizania latifolia]